MSNYDAYIWTDGSCDHEGFGGYAAVLVAKGKTAVRTDGSYETTNQRMELMAAVLGLSQLWWRADKAVSARIRSTKKVLIYSDSAYLVNCFKEQWIVTWRRNEWRRSDGKEVKNREIWETLEALVAEYKSVGFILVRGHRGNRYNELADQHAVYARISMKARKHNVMRLIGEGREEEVVASERSQPRKRRRRGRA